MKVQVQSECKYLQEERQKRLGPGGLDPVEVFEALPQVSVTSSVNSSAVTVE